MYRWLFPVPNHNYNFVRLNLVKSATAIAATLVSTVLTKTLVLPETLAFRMWKKILVSASSCVHETRVDMLTLPLDTNISSQVDTITLLLLIWDVSTAKNLNNSSLFSSIRKKECQLLGILESGRTLQRVPESLFLLADAFKVFFYKHPNQCQSYWTIPIDSRWKERRLSIHNLSECWTIYKATTCWQLLVYQK